MYAGPIFSQCITFQTEADWAIKFYWDFFAAQWNLDLLEISLFK
jgi:hypothetical protein